eukprot:4315556-Pleurochrysis_carterae.AAC.1
MNEVLADTLLRAAGAAERAGADPGGGGGAREDVTGGRVADGPRLTPSIQACVTSARTTPPAFASLRNLAPAGRAELAAEPMPSGLLETQSAEPPTARRRRGHERSALPRSRSPRGAAETRGREAGDYARPEGPVPIEALFLPGIYASRVQAWLAAADAAVARCLLTNI